MISRQLLQTLKEKERYLLIVHHSPDGDAIASAAALALGLKSIGKLVDIVCADPIPRQFKFLPLVDYIKNDFFFGDYDALIALDCGDSRRTGFRDRIKEYLQEKRKILINIDHHRKNDLNRMATYNLVDTSAPATVYLVYKLLSQFSISVNYKLATCLLTGLYTDTGGFRLPNTSPSALEFASLLLERGARLQLITKNIQQSSPPRQLRLWGIALTKISHDTKLGVVSTLITREDISAVGANETDIAGVATLLSAIPSKVSMIIIQLDDKNYQIRMRTKEENIDLSVLAKYLGGGGRKRSAGFVASGL